MRKVSKTNRILSLVLCICMVLSLIPAVPLVAEAATTPTYIASIGIAQDKHESDAKHELSGHTIINRDLNEDAGGDYIYMGYKTTTDPSKAITGIFIRSGKNPPASATFDGVTAYLVGGSNEANTGVDDVVDLNDDAGGSYLYVYVTRNTSRAPITDITFSGSNSKSGYTTPNVNLNEGAGGSSIYLHYKQFSATVSATYHYLTANGSRTSSTQSATVKHHQETMTKVPSYPSSVTYDGKTLTFQGWREDDTADAATTTSPSVTYMTGKKTYRAVYSATLTLNYGANGGSGAPSNQWTTHYINAGSTSVVKGSWTFTIPDKSYSHPAKCSFLGWSTNQSATKATYSPGNKISIDTNTTLYAVWKGEHTAAKTYVNKGTNHTYNWPCCGNSGTEAHSYTNNLCLCGAVSPDAVASVAIGQSVSYYATLNDAIQAAANCTAADKAVVTILKDIALGNRCQKIESGVFTLDLNGFEIKNTSVEYGALYLSGSSVHVTLRDSGETGKITGISRGSEVQNGSTLTMSGGTITGSSSSGVLVAYDSTAIISGGTITATGSGSSGVVVAYDSTAIISGGTITAGKNAVYVARSGMVTISGGSVTGGQYGVHAYDISTAIISGGTITGSKYDVGRYEDTSTLKLTVGEDGVGATFPGGIEIEGSKLNAILGDGVAYWAGNTMLSTAKDATGISDKGDITIKAKCTHKSGVKNYTDNGDDHTYRYSCCNLAVIESHSYADGICESCGNVCTHTGGTATCTNQAVCTVCGKSYGDVVDHPSYTNGFCTVCDSYQPATGSGTKSDPYKIGNAGQLYWFAAKVNGGKSSAWAELTADIVVNENVLNADGTLNEGTYRVWTPMGDIGHKYTGTFDGKGYTVSGLYFNDSAANYVGLFGYVMGGTVQNVGVVDSYLSGSIRVGGVVGFNAYNSTVTNCYNSGTVSGSGNYVGGVVGENYDNSIVTDCYNTGTVSGSSKYVGGVVGENDNNSTVTNCYNTGTVSGSWFVGGVVGENSNSTVTNCHNTGTVSGSDYFGGVVGENYNNSTVTNCYNTGTVSISGWGGGVVGINADSTVTNCYYDSTVCSADAIGYNSGGTVTDVLGKTTEQFASGEVAYLLSQGCTVGEGEDAVTYPGDIWGQNIDGEGEKDAYPVFSDAKVYQILNCNNEPAGYSNTEGEALGHDWDGNVCVRCNVAAQARIADTYFINFADAVAAAKEGDIIQVLTDVAIDEELTFAGFVTLQVADGVRITPNKTMVKIGTDEGMIFDNKLYFYKETDERGISIADVTKPTYYKAGDGYAIYLPATDSTEAILELHNATITTRDHELNGSSNSSKAIEWNGDLTLRFFGTNTIAAGQCPDTNRGIIVGGDLTLEGSEDAVLYVSSGKCPTASMGIQTNNLIITGGTVYVLAGESDCQSMAVSAVTVTVAEGAALYASGGITPDLSIGVAAMNVSGNINALVLTMTIISDDEVVWDVIAMGDAQLTANTQLVYHADMGYEPKTTFTVPENAVLTVNEGVTLNLAEPALESIDFSGTVVNNGIIILPADFRLEDAPKSGNVILGEQSFTWNGHMWSCTGDNHSWLDATCTDPKSCKYCGTNEGEALGHDWTDADCDTPKTCKICDTTEGEALGHDWMDADCDTPKTCNRCGTTEGEALGHKLVDRICTVCNKMPLRIEMTNFDATGWNGNAIRVCEDGQLVATVTLAEDKTGDSWYYLGDPNKTYEFYWVKGDYCGGCGFAITIGDETVMIALADENMEYADGIRIYPACEEHDYRLVTVYEPTCDLLGYTLYVCTVCGESKEDDYVPSLGHTIAEDAVGVVTPPTCENDGYTTYECDRCGESFDTLYLPALPHTLDEDGLCSVCGQPYTVPVWVAGIQIDANNLTDVLGDGTVSYDPSANVLTLNGFAYEGTDAGIYTTMSVNIVLLGENTIHTEYYGILSEVADGELTIRGTGTLTINSATVGIEMYHYGQASLVIGGSVTVSAYAEDAEGIACYSETGEASVVLQDHAKVILGTQEAPLGEECVYVDGFTCGSFTIEDNASISGITTDEEGIYVSGDQQFIVISDNASIHVCADDEALDANTIRISGGTVTAIGGEGYEGIYADELIITGGTVTVSTVEVEDRAGDGVEADCITITGGTLKILSGGLIASMDGGETNVPGTITLGEGVVIASPAGAVLGQFDLTDIGEDMVLAVLDAEGNFADSLIIQFCVHEWADADCDTPKTCILCGATEGEPLGHSYTAAYSWDHAVDTCTATGTCSGCGDVQTETVQYTITVVDEAYCYMPRKLQYDADFTSHWAEDQTARYGDSDGPLDPNRHGSGYRYVNNGDGTHDVCCYFCGALYVENVNHCIEANIINFWEGHCMAQGYIVYKCPDCGGRDTVYTDVNSDIHAAGTASKPVDNGNGTHTMYYPCCNTPSDEILDHTFVEGFCACGAQVCVHEDADNSGRCDVCGVLMQPAKPIMISVSMKGNIGVNYYMLLSDEVLADATAYMQFTLADGEIRKVPVSEGVKRVYDSETYYVFTCNVDAKEMTDDILCQFFYDGGSTQEYHYSVQTYANHILSSDYDEASKNLIKAMVNYGAASQLHFGYNTDKLANAELETPDYSGVTIQGFNAVSGQGTDLAKFYSASLILKSETTLRFFFTAPITAIYNGQELEVKGRSGLYYVDVVGISAKDLDENVTITINDGTNTADVTFNPITYCQIVQNDTTGTFDQGMKDLVSALYLYNQAANVYFKEN